MYQQNVIFNCRSNFCRWQWLFSWSWKSGIMQWRNAAHRRKNCWRQEYVSVFNLSSFCFCKIYYWSVWPGFCASVCLAVHATSPRKMTPFARL